MQDHADRHDFSPPPQPAAAQAFMLAVVAHLLLLLALTWGVNWKREAEKVTAEAELWSSLPQTAAPRTVQVPQPPTPPVVTAPPPPPPPPPPRVTAPPPPPVPAPKPPDIAVEQEKKKQELAQRRREELEQQRKVEARKKQEDLERQERQERDRKLEARKKQEEQKRQEVAEQKAAEDKKRKAEEQAKAAKAKQDEARLAALRKENMDRMMKGATGSGSPSSTGTAARSSGPSASYAGRIAAKIKPNIVFTDNVSGNPAAVVEIKVAPDGTIVGRRLLESSGVKSWDDAVVRAVDRTEVLPRDSDGTVVPVFSIRFRPRD